MPNPKPATESFVRLRGSDIGALRSAADLNLGDVEHMWLQAAKAWKSGNIGEACQHFQSCEDVLIGLAGMLIEATGKEMHICERKRP